MNIADLKNNLIDINIELEGYLNTKDLIAYNKPTAFIFSETTGEWNRSESGLGEVLVHPLFYKQICLNIPYTILALDEVFKSQNHDSELIKIYQLFRRNLHLISIKIIDLDEEAEAKGTCFLTYEQIINDIKFTYFHLYCNFYDSKYLCLSQQDKDEYAKSYKRINFFRDNSICIVWMLMEANELAEVKIEYALLELLEEDTEYLFGMILSKELRNSA